MRKFTLVSPALWKSKRFLALSDSEKLLFTYYLTCHHQNCAGSFQLPDAYACADLGWPTDKYAAARHALIEASLIQFDHDTSELIVERWFQHSSPTNPKHYLGVVR